MKYWNGRACWLWSGYANCDFREATCCVQLKPASVRPSEWQLVLLVQRPSTIRTHRRPAARSVDGIGFLQQFQFVSSVDTARAPPPASRA